MFEYKRLIPKNKNNKVGYYISNYLRLLIPLRVYSFFKTRVDLTSSPNAEQLNFRLNYYNQIEKSELPQTASTLDAIKLKKGRKSYYFDFKKYLNYYNQKLRILYLFGDITENQPFPTFTKSRPISPVASNNVLLKWNRMRHFVFVNDQKQFSEKLDMLVWRGKIKIETPGKYLKTQQNRLDFLESYFDHSMCNVGLVNKPKIGLQWKKQRLSLSEQLKYKFILSLEGTDVASNLKWIMSSNSVAVMPKPKFETWFMEGTLVADYHYVCIKDDYSDLEEKLQFFLRHPYKATTIIKNANAFVAKFKIARDEHLLSRAVIEKYFKHTGQM